MRLSTYSDYMVRVLIQAALRQPERVTVDEVATTFGISRNHLVKVVHNLGRSGHLVTRRGVGGGFTLALSPDQIGLGDLIRFGEGTDTVFDCKDKNDQICPMYPACQLRSVLDEAAEAFFSVLDKYTLQNLIDQPQALKRVLHIDASLTKNTSHSLSPLLEPSLSNSKIL